MCDYSLESFENRPAKVGDKLKATKFRGGGTVGFTEVGGPNNVAVCLRPGTELVFEDKPTWRSFFGWGVRTGTKTARFRQVDLERYHTHHDALEFADGRVVLLTNIQEGQLATVIQMPIEPTKKKLPIAETPELVD